MSTTLRDLSQPTFFISYEKTRKFMGIISPQNYTVSHERKQ